MSTKSLEVIKDLLGFIGAVLALVPFIRDFFQRTVVRRWVRLRDKLTALRGAVDKVTAAEQAKLHTPSIADANFVMVGILFLIASFAVSLYISAHEAAGPRSSQCPQSCSRVN